MKNDRTQEEKYHSKPFIRVVLKNVFNVQSYYDIVSDSASFNESRDLINPEATHSFCGVFVRLQRYVVGGIDKGKIRLQKFHYRNAALGVSRSNTVVLRGQATTRCVRKWDLWW